MVHVAAHLSLEDLAGRLRAAPDARSARHLQAIWLLAKGHAMAEVSSTTAFGVRWIEKLLARYNAQGPDALGDLRRHNGTSRVARHGGWPVSGSRMAGHDRIKNMAEPTTRGKRLVASASFTWPARLSQVRQAGVTRFGRCPVASASGPCAGDSSRH